MFTKPIEIRRTTNPKALPDENALGFGKYFTDHMFVMNYDAGQGWHNPRIVPHGPIELDPGAAALHYGQANFEGLKAYNTADGRVVLFRPKMNIERMNSSNERICMPPIDPAFYLHAMKTLVRIEREWIPKQDGNALYIRPVVFATEAFLGVRASKSYQFILLLSPVGPYYPQGLKPVNIYVERHFVRSVRGGVGFAKTAGNYAAGLKAQSKATEHECVQVLWLDAIERKYIEEVGAMNVFFKIRGKVITPPLEGTILAGVTRLSSLELLKHWGIPVEERRLSFEEVETEYKNGGLEEVFGTGTAAVISPVGKLITDSMTMTINNGEIGPLTRRLYAGLTGIQRGTEPDPFGWMDEVSLEPEPVQAIPVPV